MTTLALLAFLKGLMWTLLLYVAIRRRDWLSIAVVCAAYVSNALIANGLTLEASVLGVPIVALIVYLLIDRLDKNPAHVERVMALQVQDARRQMHDIESDRASWEARAVAYRRLLAKHDIQV